MALRYLSFRNRLLMSFLFMFIPLLLFGSGLIYFKVREILQTNIEKELQDTTDALADLIEISASLAIKTRLQAIAEKNREIARHCYQRFQSGEISRDEAVDLISEIFLSQSIGTSGYIYCLNSQGRIEVHPNHEVLHSDLSGYDFVQRQLAVRDGYLEYEWKNPGETVSRPKVLYMVYFEPLDWIISVSSYREEFYHLLDISDFKDNILSCRTGSTGYAYVIAENGSVLVHPAIQGINMLQQSAYPNDFARRIVQEKTGKIKYFWKNPGENQAREKLVIFRHLPDYKWIVATSSYVDEIFSPLKTFRNLLLGILATVVLASAGIAYFISTSVTRPLASLMDKLEQGAKGNYAVRMDDDRCDEFGKLARHFNAFMGELEKKRSRIEDEIRKNAEVRAALVENDLKLRSLFNQSFQYTGILSPSGILEEINQSGIEFIGCTMDDILYRPFWQIPCWRHDQGVRRELKEALASVLQKRFVRFETTAVSGTDEIRDIDISIQSVLHPTGEVAFIIAECRDITENKQAAQERKNLAVQLEKSQKMEAIGTLAGGIAHDFNNILSGILGYTQLAELSINNPAKAKIHLSHIFKGAQRAADLTQQILAFSRQTEYEKHSLSLYIVVKEALKLLRSSIPATIDIVESIRARSRIMADPTQMHQVVMNLCTNAYHAMAEKGGILQVGLNEKVILSERDVFDQEMTNGTYLELSVSDTGHGMTAEILKKIFDPYFTTKQVGKGTGFGLPLVHAIVEEHGGYIKVTSRPGEGSCFYIYLPVAGDSDGLDDSHPKLRPSVPVGTERIMVVDDEYDIRAVIQEFLTSCGYRVQVFENGVQAFESFENDPTGVDLVITDMTMPQMTGEELARRVLTLRPDLPVILCTGYSEVMTEGRAQELGIAKYVQKPLSNKDLAGIIREILDAGKQETT